jgi:hypothetical protein
MLDGKVIGDSMLQHRHQESIRFLKRMDTETPAEVELHLIVDNKSALVLFVGVFPMVAIMPSGHQISAAIHHAVTENL